MSVGGPATRPSKGQNPCSLMGAKRKGKPKLLKGINKAAGFKGKGRSRLEQAW